VVAVRDHLDELGDGTVVVVTFGSADAAARYQAELGGPFPVLRDRRRHAYRRFGFERAGTRTIYRWATLRRYVDLLRRGRRLRRPVDDTHQLGGDVVIGSDGHLAYLRRQVAPDDRPTVDELVRAVGDARTG
jgi:peroxiredoxin